MGAAEDDRSMLRSLEGDKRLGDAEREAFASMLDALEAGQQRLTVPQRDWVRDRCEDLGLLPDEGAQNLWSSGRVPRGTADKTARQLEAGVATIRGREFKLERPLRPPGR